MDNWIYPCYCAQGTWQQIPQDACFGYNYFGQFYSHEAGYNFGPQGVPVLWSPTMGYVQLPYGTTFWYYFNQQWYRTKSEATDAVNQYYMMTVSSPAALPANIAAAAPPAEAAVPPVDTAGPSAIPAPSQPAEADVPQPPRPAAKKACVGCPNPSADFLVIFGRCLCIDCLFTRYMEDKFVCDLKSQKDPKEWSAKIIAEVHNYLKTHLLGDKRAALPATIKLPPDSFICVGRDDPVYPGHPASGHIAGNRSKCMEDACPDHEYCKGCALKATKCSRCESFIAYEELPPCPPDCQNHQPSFTEPCPACHAITPRTKVRPPNP